MWDWQKMICLPWLLIVDTDECTEGTAGCTQSCMNTDGSYACSCISGYRLAADGHGCEGSYHHHALAPRPDKTFLAKLSDVNECTDDSLNPCEQLCNNTHASHSCLCFDGYRLNNDSFSCAGMEYTLINLFRSSFSLISRQASYLLHSSYNAVELR